MRFVLACWVCVAMLGTSRADDGAKSGLLAGTPREQAFELFEMATRMFGDEDFVAAAVTFGQAAMMLSRLDRGPDGTVIDKQAHEYRSAAMSNQATAYNRAGLYVEAGARFAALLEQFGPELSPTDKQEIIDAIAVTESKIGTVQLDNLPEGDVEVRFDGRLERRDLRAPLRMPEGEHSIEVRASGFKPYVETFTVVGKQALALALPLVPLTTPALLRVEASVGSTSVDVDGKRVGIAPLEISIAPGAHRVVVASESYKTQSTELRVKPGERAIFRAAMAHTRAPLGLRLSAAFIASFPLRTDTPFGSFGPGIGLQLFHDLVRARNLRLGVDVQFFPRELNAVGVGVVATWCPDRFASERGVTWCPATAVVDYVFGEDTDRYRSGEGAARIATALEVHRGHGFARISAGLRLENYAIDVPVVGAGSVPTQLLLWSSVLEASVGLDL
jgi:hypothetical protein